MIEMRAPMTDKFWGTAEVLKRNKRLMVRVIETDQILYVPPDFIRPHIRSRAGLQALADAFTQKQRRCIEAIAAFEAAPH